jgi:ATP-dependent Clp protease protease subunit
VNDITSVTERIIYLSEEIDIASAGTITNALINLINKDDEQDNKEKNFERKPIKFYINSNGGSVYDSWGIIDTILTSKTPIYTYCTGQAMSSGLLLFLAGHKRFTNKHSTFVCHAVSDRINGNIKSMDEALIEDKRVQQQLEEYIIERTKITQKKLNEIKEKKIDWFISAEEAIELEIANEIIS